MISPVFAAAFLAAIPAVFAQTSGIPRISSNSTGSTSYFTRCTTNYGYYPLPTGYAGVPTWITYSRTTQTVLTTTTVQVTSTVTPNATTCGGGFVTETSTVTSTSTTTPPATTIGAKAGQLPLLNFDPNRIDPTPAPTGISRIKRLQAGSELEVRQLISRKTSEGNTGGILINPDGTVSTLNMIYPHRVLCERRRTIIVTREVIENAPATTVTLAQGTATAARSTITVTSTVIVQETAPTPKVYAACGGNNVVNSVTDLNGNRMNFDRIIYRPSEGFPIANEIVVNTTTPVSCCGACQDTPNCAGSFFIPSMGQCHLRLTTAAPTLPQGATLAPPTNSTNSSLALPTASGIFYTGTAISASILPTGAVNSSVSTIPVLASPSPLPNTCALGSLSLYLGTIRGRPTREFPDRFAMYFSNGPCGRFSVSPIPVNNGEIA